MTITKGTYAWTVTMTGRKEIIVGIDFMETFKRAIEYFNGK